ncbi:MAG: fibronectin type III domain-containing protein, partial [Pyrinomonadaceae bacterium]
MRIANNHLTKKINAQTCAAILIMTLLAGAALWPLTRARAQGNSSPSASAGVAAARKAGYEIDKKDQDPDSTDQVFLPSPDTVTATSYPFTSSSTALEDMSSGTTQLVAANQDDTASAVTNIGFDVWFDGVRQTQFSVNANGLMGLGAVAVNNGASGRTNDFATATNNPKMSAYWDDLCTASTGKVHYKVVGSAPNRKLVVEWLNIVQFDNGTIACGTSILGTWQVWLFETTGVVELVNGGTAINVDTGNAGYSVGIGSGAASFASVTTTGPTVSYAASNNTQLNAIAAGTKYTFTPNVPAAPTGLNFTAVSQVAMTLNWTDNATNEVGYAIYQSTDNVNFTFVTQTAANATSQVVSGLS